MVSTTENSCTAATNRPAADNAATCLQPFAARTATALDWWLRGLSGCTGNRHTASATTSASATTTMVLWPRHHRAGAGAADGCAAAVCISLLLPGTSATLGRCAANVARQTAIIHGTFNRKSAGKSVVRLASARRHCIPRLGYNTLRRLSGTCDTRICLVKTRDTRHVRGSSVISSGNSLCCWSGRSKGDPFVSRSCKQ